MTNAPKTLRDKAPALLIVDIQEAFRGVIFELEKVLKNAVTCVEAFKIFDLPILVSEQYPRGLGATVSEITSVLPEKAFKFEKTKFSAFTEDLERYLRADEVETIVVCGVETHVCVNQTVADLVSAGFEVFVLSDCVSSRSADNKAVGIAKIASYGAVISSLETALFEILGDAKNPNFKAVQNLIK